MTLRHAAFRNHLQHRWVLFIGVAFTVIGVPFPAHGSGTDSPPVDVPETTVPPDQSEILTTMQPSMAIFDSSTQGILLQEVFTNLAIDDSIVDQKLGQLRVTPNQTLTSLTQSPSALVEDQYFERFALVYILGELALDGGVTTLTALVQTSVPPERQIIVEEYDSTVAEEEMIREQAVNGLLSTAQAGSSTAITSLENVLSNTNAPNVSRETALLCLREFGYTDIKLIPLVGADVHLLDLRIALTAQEASDLHLELPSIPYPPRRRRRSSRSQL